MTPHDMIADRVTGRQVPLAGAEENRQAVEKILLAEKGYPAADIEVDVPIRFDAGGEEYASRVDLVLRAEGMRLIVVKCVAGSLGSYEREAVSAARLLDDVQIPLAAVSDGRNVVLLDTISGRQVGDGWEDFPDHAAACRMSRGLERRPYPQERLEREKLVFRSYDSMRVNVPR